MSAGEAPGEIIIAIGSPGTTRSSTKIATPTPVRVIAAIARRLRSAEAMPCAGKSAPGGLPGALF